MNARHDNASPDSDTDSGTDSSTDASPDSSTGTSPQPLGHRLVTLTPDDAERIKTIEDLVWFEVGPGQSAQDYIDELDFARTRGVEIDSEGDVEPLPGVEPGSAIPLVGIYSSFDMQVAAPGAGGGCAVVPMSGLTWVGVHGDHRRKGILRSMMTDHLHGLHDAGEFSVAGLNASEVGIYGRFGYGTAAPDVHLALGRGTTLTAGPELDALAEQVQTWFVPIDTPAARAAMQEVALAAVGTTLGAMSRNDALAAVVYRDFPKTRGSKEPRQLMLARRDGVLSGYAVFRRESKWDDAQPNGEVSVPELAAADDASLLALARRLVDLDLTAKARFGMRSHDDPLIWWAGGPRAVSVKTYDATWIRLVDVDKALTARGYAGAVDVVIEVDDELCPWNARRWRLVAGDDGIGTCTPTDDAADLRLPVAALGAAYLGGRTISAQARQGLVTELRAGAVAELSRAMRGDVEPLGGLHF